MVRLLPLTLFLGVSFCEGIDYSQCNRDMNVSAIGKNPYGSLETFYDIVQGIANGVESELSDEVMTDLYNFITQSSEKKSLGDTINEVVKNQAGAIVFFSVGIVIIAISLVIGITVCCCRCCCGAGSNPKSNPSKIGGVLAAIGMVISIAFIVTGVVIFNISVNNLNTAIQESAIYTNNISIDIQTNINNGADEVTCTLQTSLNESSMALNSQMVAFPNAFFFELYNVTQLNIFLDYNYQPLLDEISQTLKNCRDAASNTAGCLPDADNFKKGLETACSALETTQTSVVQLQQLSANMTLQMNTLNTTMTQQVDEASATMQTVINEVMSQTAQVKTILEQMTKFMNDVDDRINKFQKNVVDWSGYDPVKAAVQAGMSIPNLLAALFALIAVVGLLCWFCCRGRAPVFGYLSAVGFYTTIFTVWIAMGFCSAFFVGGWAISGACQPMFDDPSLRFFKVLTDQIPAFTYEYKILGSSETNITVYDTLMSCSAGNTVFTAINASEQINLELINNMLNLTTYEDAIIGQMDVALDLLSSTWDPSYLDNLDSALNLMKNESTNLQTAVGIQPTTCSAKNLAQETVDGINNIDVLLQDLVNNISLVLYNSTSNETKSSLVNFVQGQFDQVNTLTNSTIDSAMNQLANNTFPCTGLYQSYQNVGNLLCDVLGRPVHGMWGAAGLAALFFIPLALLLLCTASILRAKRTRYYIEDEPVPVKADKKSKKQKKNKISTWDDDAALSSYETSSAPYQRSTSDYGRRPQASAPPATYQRSLTANPSTVYPAIPQSEYSGGQWD